MRCARCHYLATHQARRHGVTIPMCTAHHATVWQGLVTDGWIISPVRQPVNTSDFEGGPEAYVPLRPR